MDFEFFWNTYEESFPPDERRSWEQQLTLMNDERYHIHEVEYKGSPIGFIAYWDFDTFVFIEHFAMASSARGNGVGSNFLSDFLSKQIKPVVLEVEPPVEDIQFRRISFYERLGFHLSPYTHMQKAYVAGRNGVLLQLMGYPVPLNDLSFQEVERTLFSTLYKPD